MDGRWVAGLVGAGALALAGCGGSGAAPGAGSCDGGCWQPTAADQSFISSYCGIAAGCCPSNGYAQTTVASTCASTLTTGGVSGDPSLQAACLADLQALAGTQYCLPDPGDVGDPCTRVFDERSGPQQPGQPCAHNADCAGVAGGIALCARHFAPSGAFVGLVCAQYRPGKAGDHTCLGDYNAGVLTFVVLDDGKGPLVASGVYCSAQDGLYCNQTNDPTTQACTSYLPDGITCEESGFCASGSCIDAQGNRVSGSPGTCAHTSMVGGSCNPGNVCDATSVCDNSVPGAAVCVARAAAGAACQIDQDCLGNFCDSTGHCAQSLAESLAVDEICVGVF